MRLHHAAAEVGAHLVLFADQPVDPGSGAFVQLVLERTIAAAVGDRFILRHPLDQRTIGGGRFLDLRAPARKRRTPERLDQLAACALEDPAESLATLLVRAPYFVDFSAFARDRALADGESEQLARELALVQIAAPVGVIVVSELTSKRLDESLLGGACRLPRRQSRPAGDRHGTASPAARAAPADAGLRRPFARPRAEPRGRARRGLGAAAAPFGVS